MYMKQRSANNGDPFLTWSCTLLGDLVRGRGGDMVKMPNNGSHSFESKIS